MSPLIQELENIIANEKDFIPFLKKLSDADKKELIPFIKKEYSYIRLAFVCLNRDTFLEMFSSFNWKPSIRDIIPWYIPNWFITYYKGENISLNYQGLAHFNHKKLVYFSKNEISQKLSNSLLLSTSKKVRYQPEILELFPETLHEHIWYLFEEESNIYEGKLNYGWLTEAQKQNLYDKKSLAKSKIFDTWIDAIGNLIKDKKLDRTKVLQATVDTTSKNFNSKLSGWFFELLLQLEPTESELVDLQDDLFTALNSPHSKVINTTLKLFKKINLEQFKQKEFVEIAAILLNSETKSVVSATLVWLEKIAKANKKLVPQICFIATQTFANIDSKIQLKAAKFIVKYGDKSADLKTEINNYADNLAFEVKELLASYLEDTNTEVVELPEFKNEVKTILNDAHKIGVYESFDDILFFINQVLENNEVYHSDLLFSYLPKLNALVNEDNIKKLNPLFKRAIPFSNWNKGVFTYIGARLLVEYYSFLIEKFPSQLSTYEVFREHKYDGYGVQYKLSGTIKQIFKNNLNLELLSMPTHQPCWITPNALINRILDFEKHDIRLNTYDFQIAISRIPLEDFTIDKEKLDLIQDSDIKTVLHYYFDFLPLENVSSFEPLEFWIMAVVCKRNKKDIAYFKEKTGKHLKAELANHAWTHEPEEYVNYFKQTVTKTELKFEDNTDTKTIYNSLCSEIHNYKHGAISESDVIKFLYKTPNNIEFFIQLITNHCLWTSSFEAAGHKHSVVNSLKGLLDIWCRKDYREPVYVFLAASLLCSDKLARQLAAELWIKTIPEDTLNNQLLGETIGKLQYNEYAGLKRLTDSFTENMFKVSKTHDEALFELIEAIISNMNPTPIKGCKKLLEILLELQHSTSQKLSEHCLSQLQTWSETKSLKPIIKKLTA